MTPRTTANLALLSSILAVFTAIAVGAAHTSDAKIESSVKESYVYRNTLKDDKIQVRSVDGAVTLTGTVAAEHHKALANDAAAAQHGVKSVDNTLQLDAAAPAPKSDAWLATKVKAMLLFHRSVSAVKTEVAAKDGVVTLTGTAGTQAQKDLTGEYALDVEGVSGINNNITLSGAGKKGRRLEEKLDDSSITAQVKLTLLFHRSTSAFNTHVETRRGVVTLSGTAKSAAEKDLAEKIVSDVKGVRGVTNRIDVVKA